MLTGRLSCCFRLSVRSSWTAAAAAVRSVSPPRLKHRPAPPRSNSRRLRTRPSSLTKRKTLQLFCPSPARATRSIDRFVISSLAKAVCFCFCFSSLVHCLLRSPVERHHLSHHSVDSSPPSRKSPRCPCTRAGTPSRVLNGLCHPASSVIMYNE